MPKGIEALSEEEQAGIAAAIDEASGVPSDDEPTSDDTSSGDVQDDETAGDESEAPEDETEEPSSVDDESAGDGVDDESTEDVDEESVQDVAARFGFTEDEAEQFGSVEEVERQATLRDKYVVEQARARRQRQQAGKKEDDADTATQQTAAEQPAEEEKPFNALIEHLRADGYDEALIQMAEQQQKVIERQQAHIASQQEQFNKHLSELQNSAQAQREAQIQAQQQAEQSAFIGHIDALEMQDLFGSERGSNEEQKRNASEVFDNVRILREQAHYQGRSTEITPELVKRAVRLSFQKQIDHKAAQQRTKKVQGQSKQRMGKGSSSKGSGGKTAYTGTPKTDPEFQKLAKQHDLELV